MSVAHGSLGLFVFFLSEAGGPWMGDLSLISQSDKIGPSQGFLPLENAGLLLYLAIF